MNEQEAEVIRKFGEEMHIYVTLIKQCAATNDQPNALSLYDELTQMFIIPLTKRTQVTGLSITSGNFKTGIQKVNMTELVKMIDTFATCSSIRRSNGSSSPLG